MTPLVKKKKDDGKHPLEGKINAVKAVFTVWPGAAILVVADPAGGLPIGQVGFYPAG